MTTHSPIPISDAGRWMKCPASCQMQARYPSGDSKSSLDGSAAHDCAARMLQGEDVKAGDFAENMQIFTDEMISGALLYKRDVESVTDGKSDLVIEKQVFAPHISPFLFGTPDCWTVVTDTLVVWDYKYGFLSVDAYENYQGIGYAICIQDQIPTNVDTVQIRIVQPRAYHTDGPIKTWSFGIDDLKDKYAPEMSRSINAALSPTATTLSGPWCRNCSALLRCNAARERSAALMEFVGTSTPTEPDPYALAMELSLLKEVSKDVEHRLKAVEALATSRIRAGELIPGYTVKPSYSRLKWSHENDVIIALADIQNIDICKPSEIITPTQASDKGMNISDLANKQQTGFKLQKVEPLKIFAEK